MFAHSPPRFDAEQRVVSRAPASERSFEAQLRRDLALSQIVAFDPVIGGAGKRFCDLLIVVLCAPLWAIALLVATFTIKRRQANAHAPIWVVEECVGYGGAVFKRRRLNVIARSAVVIALDVHGEHDTPIEPPEASATELKRGITWTELLERLPELISVLKGDMSLIGPRPITEQEFGALRSARKYYASARPGVLSMSDCVADSDSRSLSYKYYAVYWSLEVDREIAIEALRPLKATQS